MEMRRSKIFKMQGKKDYELTDNEREFKRAVLRQRKYGRDEKIMLGFGLVVLFILSLTVNNDFQKGMLDVFIFLVGLAGTIM